MSISNSLGAFDLDLINLRKPLKFSDGTIQDTAYTGGTGVPTLAEVLASGDDGNEQDIVNINTLELNYEAIGNPYLFEDWISLNSAGGVFHWNYQNASGGRITVYHQTLAASLLNVGKRRQGLLQLRGLTPLATEMLSAVSTEPVFNTSNLLLLTFGFIPLGDGWFGTLGTDVGEISQGFGICSASVNLNLTMNGIMWRLYSNTAGIPTWTLVENNVIKETLSGANLTGGLTNKWCRASIVFPTSGTYYGVFTNLTDGVSYTTAVYNITAPTTDSLANYIFFGSGNTDAGEPFRSLGFDYLFVQQRCLPIDKSNSVATSR